MKNLTNIANSHKCDKGDKWYEKHGYTHVYDKYVPERGECSLLEIGVWRGDSIRMWKEWNKELQIDAIDIDSNVLNYIQSEDGTNIYIGNATDKVFLTETLKSMKYDFIIDDGSHNMMDILISLRCLWKRVKPGGFYFIEDLHASHARRSELLVELIIFFGEDSSLKCCRIFCNDKLLVLEKL